MDLNVLTIILSIIIVLVSLTFHEYAHAAAANALGDPTARLLGRMSVNPLVHIDPIGTILVPVALAISGLGAFGWAKPVPVNPLNLKHTRRDDAIISAAGPAANFVLAILSAIAMRGLIYLEPMMSTEALSFLFFLFFMMIRINIFLMLFNLLPITPLDGSGVLHGFLSRSAWEKFTAHSQAMMIGFMMIVLLTNWFHDYYLRPVGRIFFYLLGIVAGVDLYA